MQSEVLSSIRRLSDDELVARVRHLVAGERGGMVQVVAHLAELDTRDVHYRLGHGSLFAYCRDVLGFSEQEAYNRICVARAARRFPVVLQMLEDGTINLTTARLLVPHLTPENHISVLESARGKSKAQVEELAAALWPRPDVPSLVRKLPVPRPIVTPGSPPARIRAGPRPRWPPRLRAWSPTRRTPRRFPRWSPIEAQRRRAPPRLPSRKHPRRVPPK